VDGEASCKLGAEHLERRDFNSGGSSETRLRVAEIEDWKDRYEHAAENAFRSRPKNEEALQEEEIKKLKQKVGSWCGTMTF